MKKILVAGATGYLGGFIVKQLKAQNYWVRVLVRNTKQAEAFKGLVDDVFIGQITDKNSLNDVMTDIDMVMSSVGITRQRDGMTYLDVDYGANLNLLELAEHAQIEKFLYVSVINADKMAGIHIIDAKEKFVRRLERSKIGSVIVRPNGFFSDMREILKIAQNGTGWLIGNGEVKISPISGADLAVKCVECLTNGVQEIEIGGPTTYTFNELYAIAFKVAGKPLKLTTIPLWVVRPLMVLVKFFTSSKTYGPIEFFVAGLTLDNPRQGTLYGKDTLEAFFRKSL